MKPEPTISAQTDDAWDWLTDQLPGRSVRFYLTGDGRLRHGEGDGETIGCFTRAIELEDFRDEVFHVYAQLRRATHGRG